MEFVRVEIRVSSQFSHPNLLPLLDHAVITVKASQDQSLMKHTCFPVHLDGTLLDSARTMKVTKGFFSTSDTLQIFCQDLSICTVPYAQYDVKPGNVLVTYRRGLPPLAMLIDFGSARPARKQI